MDSEYSAHGRPSARSHRQCWPESTHCKWPCQGVTMYTPQPSSINIAQELGRGDNSWAPPRHTESETGGAAQVTRSLPSPTGDSDINSSLRTTDLLRLDPIFPGTGSISCCPWPSCCSHTAHQRQFSRQGPLLTSTLLRPGAWPISFNSDNKNMRRRPVSLFPEESIAAERASTACVGSHLQKGAGTRV